MYIYIYIYIYIVLNQRHIPLPVIYATIMASGKKLQFGAYWYSYGHTIALIYTPLPLTEFQLLNGYNSYNFMPFYNKISYQKVRLA